MNTFNVMIRLDLYKTPSWRVATSPEALVAQVQLWCLPRLKETT